MKLDKIPQNELNLNFKKQDYTKYFPTLKNQNN